MPLFAERYEMGPVIGQGGMAEVRAAHDTRLERPVAIKIMRPELAHQPLVRERFESEARMAARLIHPNVVSVWDSGEADGLPYIVMERLPGDTLRDRLSSGPMSEPEVRHLAMEVLAALGTAHAAGILHRDIKPANVLAAGDGHWKVGDFGIAKALEVDSGDATSTGLVLGTPAYLAPERLLGEPATVASDMFAVGVILYEALSGGPPFGKPAPGAWPGVVAGAPLVPLASIRPGVDPVLASAIERGLSRDPAQRYWSAAEMAAAIGGPGGVVRPQDEATAVMAAGPATEIMRAGPATEMMAAASATEMMPTGPRRPPPVGPASETERRRHPAALVLGALAGLAALAAILIAVVTSGHGGNGGSPATSQTTAPATSATTAAATTVATTAPPTTLAPTTTVPPSTTTSSTSTTTSTTSPTVTIPLPVGATAGPGGKPKKH